MEREYIGCSTCQGIIHGFVKEKEADLVEAPDSDNAPTEDGQPAEAATPIELLWPVGQVFQVWILNTADKSKFTKHIEYVKEGVKEWEKYANVSFTFPEVWDKNSPPEVRLRFFKKGLHIVPEDPHHNIRAGNWSYVGKTCELVVEDDIEPNFWNPNMSLEPAELRRYGEDFKATILHEFGHFLGFMHEHQRPDAQFLINYNMAAVYSNYQGMGWNKKKVDEQVLAFHYYKDKSAIAGTKFDTTSIMMYDLPPEILMDPTKAVPKNMRLSKLDKEFVAKIYPKGTEERERTWDAADIIPDPGEIIPSQPLNSTQ